MANHLANKGITVQLWAREEEVELLASLCIS
jgi:3-hydroxyisobutyrate dehydrogenase-like beta-hydroxyacid dehydrogenase